MKRTHLACLILCLTTTFLLSQSSLIPAPISASQADPKRQTSILDSYGKLPLSFEANHGQTHASVKFLSRTNGYSLFLTGDEAVFALNGKKPDPRKAKIVGVAQLLPPDADAPGAGGVLRMKLRNANPAAKVIGMDELAGTSNYFIGNDRSKWHSNVPTYAKVKYEGIYPGIDLLYYGNQRQLEYDFIVAPGADPRRIAFDLSGAKRIRQDAHGDLVLKVGEDEIRWHKPVVYQEKNGARQEIAAHYAITNTNRVGFEIPKYDASRPLYIDPLIYATFLGGITTGSIGYGIAVDSLGNAYVTGSAGSDFPTTPGAFQTTCGGNNNCGGGDVFVTKINPSGTALVYSTYLGGSGQDNGYGIAADSVGNAYVTGYTTSTDFPTMNPWQQTYGGGSSDAFVTKINSSGTALVYSTYLGGSLNDSSYGIAVDSMGNAYVTGQTASTNFPTMNPLQPAYGGGSSDGFVTKLDPSGLVLYSSDLGGSAADWGAGIAVDSSGNAYVTGRTISTNYPRMNPLQPVCGGAGGFDAFVTKINPTGSALVYSTCLGGTSVDDGYGIAVDSSDNAYVTGATTSTDFPTTPGVFQKTCGGTDSCAKGDVFVAKINPSGTALVYSSYLGGSDLDYGYGIAVDSAGDTYVTGETHSTDFPTMNPFQPTLGSSGRNAFVTEINPAGTALLYSTYLGGNGLYGDSGSGIVADSIGNFYVTG